jgi:hypothetical protein
MQVKLKKNVKTIKDEDTNTCIQWQNIKVSEYYKKKEDTIQYTK